MTKKGNVEPQKAELMREVLTLDGVKYELIYVLEDDTMCTVVLRGAHRNPVVYEHNKNAIKSLQIKIYGKDKGIQFPFEFMTFLYDRSPTKYQDLKRDIKNAIKEFAHSKEARQVLYRIVIKSLVMYLTSLERIK